MMQLVGIGVTARDRNVDKLVTLYMRLLRRYVKKRVEQRPKRRVWRLHLWPILRAVMRVIQLARIHRTGNRL